MSLDLDLDRLEQLARACPMPDEDPDVIDRWYVDDGCLTHGIGQPADRAFVAACSPDVVLQLIERARELERTTVALKLAQARADDAEAIANAALRYHRMRERHRTDGPRLASVKAAHEMLIHACELASDGQFVNRLADAWDEGVEAVDSPYAPTHPNPYRTEAP